MVLARVIEKAIAVHQSKEGFESIYDKICQTIKVTNKTEVIVGIEPGLFYTITISNNNYLSFYDK
ncbi:hypothetical protein AMD00_09415 [Viridibacillus arvi]|uniref:Uncharacterized protein n=1 Tax=Viridibacillus arvi TaxID=263475 RepID=A0A0M0LCB5_9BACL|nr:hypothetical protein AMD00_09415 [Viridibacillus arvi]